MPLQLSACRYLHMPLTPQCKLIKVKLPSSHWRNISGNPSRVEQSYLKKNLSSVLLSIYKSLEVLSHIHKATFYYGLERPVYGQSPLLIELVYCNPNHWRLYNWSFICGEPTFIFIVRNWLDYWVFLPLFYSTIGKKHLNWSCHPEGNELWRCLFGVFLRRKRVRSLLFWPIVSVTPYILFISWLHM